MATSTDRVNRLRERNRLAGRIRREYSATREEHDMLRLALLEMRYKKRQSDSEKV